MKISIKDLEILFLLMMGKAATIDQFVDKILENNKEINPEKFKVWYKQNGTPLS